jgi:polygalacturonase
MKMNIRFKIVSTVCLSMMCFGLVARAQAVTSQTFTIVDFGAKADGHTVCTVAIQKTIDQCSVQGGGVVLVPAGTFITGSIKLKNNVTLHLQHQAVLQASTDSVDYPGDKKNKSVIAIDSVENVSIAGDGTIDGMGIYFSVANEAPNRPFLVLVKDSKNIRLEDITLKNSAYWTLKLLGSEHVFIRGISIYSHANFNNDGIDIDSKDVVISDCIVDCDDDGLCLKSDRKVPTENIVITNCIVASNCNFIKMGTASFGGFKNISISNCVLRHASESNLRKWNKRISGVIDSIVGISGIALEVVDGGFMDQVTISNISMDGVQTPIFMRLGSRRNPTGSLKNVMISNIIATTHSLLPSSITAVPGFYIENVILRDIRIKCKGEGTLTDGMRPVPENEKGYPENRMFGNSLPAYGFYVRHAKNIYFDDIQLTLLQPDFRPAFWLEDAHDITMRNMKADNPSGSEPLIKKIQSSDVSVQ